MNDRCATYTGPQCVSIVLDHSQPTLLSGTGVGDRRSDGIFVDAGSDVRDRKCFGGMLVHSRSLSRVALVGALGASAIYASRLGSALVRRLTPPAGGPPPFHSV